MGWMVNKPGGSGTNQSMLIVSSDVSAVSDIEQVVSFCLPETIITTTDEMSEIPSLIRSIRPKIIILDLNGRTMDTYKALAEMRKITRATIITLSYVRDPSITVKSLEMEADHHLTKPISQMEFIAQVRACLRRSQSRFEHLGRR